MASRPYIMMTLELLNQTGCKYSFDRNIIRIDALNKPIQSYFNIECDWSSASFWYGMLALSEKREITFPGSRRTGLQSDEHVAEIFLNPGIDILIAQDYISIQKSKKIKSSISCDFFDCPDLALPVIITCAAMGVKARFTGMENLAFKESDRLEAILPGLLQIGSSLKKTDPRTWTLEQIGKPKSHILNINSSYDHRITVSFATLTAAGYKVQIDHPEVVNKSYPGFWKDLTKLGFLVEEG